jgi:hypothetical protein
MPDDAKGALAPRSLKLTNFRGWRFSERMLTAEMGFGGNRSIIKNLLLTKQNPGAIPN